MPIYRLNEQLWFPEPDEYDHDIVAVGGDLSKERLLLAYSMGLFPWYNKEDEILWWCPQNRSLLILNDLHISHSMRAILHSGKFRFTLDQCFDDVIRACQTTGNREGATWIHPEVIESYGALHQAGLAHSVEVWNGDELVGGLYGVSLGRAFFGESMFSQESNSSKAALITLARTLQEHGFEWIDCQVQSEHLSTLGASEVDRSHFLILLERALKNPTNKGSWSTWMNP